MTIRTVTLSAVVSVFATPALADLTSDDVLDALTTQLSFFDMLEVSVQGKERTGDTLAVASVSATIDIEDVPLTVSVGPFTYQDLADGSVAILYPEPITIRMITADENGAPIEATVDVEMADTSHIATGTPERIRYTFSAPETRVTNLVIEAEESFEPDLELIVTNISSVVEIASGDLFSQTVDYAFDTMTADFAFDEEQTGNAQFKIAMADVAVDYDIEFSLETVMTSLSQALRDGNHLAMNMTTGEYIQDMRIETPYDNSVIQSRTGESTLHFRLDKDGLSYEAGYKDSHAEMSGSDIPLPSITYGLDEADMAIAFPLLPGDGEAQPFAARMTLLGLTTDEAIWSLFDPTGQLPRNPIDFVLDLEGTTEITEDFLTPEALDGLDQPPFANTFVKLNEMRFSAAGAELTGNGEVTDTSKNGIPSGKGRIDMALTGGNTLLDTLVGMGLVPEDQAMGARMMLGLFARPGEGEDTLVSTIEVNEDGSVTANGQRIK